MLRIMSLGVAALALVASSIAFPKLPMEVAIHWNAAGQADGFGPPLVAVLIIPGVMLALLALFAVLPKISPRGYGLEAQRDVYDGVVLSVLVFLLFVHAMLLAVAFGVPVRIERVIPAAVSLLFVALGGFIGRAKPNFYLGIRTPWTLTSEANWLATHRFTARLFVAGGLGLAAGAALGAPFWLVFAGFLTLGLLPMGYSLAYWLKERAT